MFYNLVDFMSRRKHMQKVIDQALTIHTKAEKLGLGVDVVEIDRMRKICKRTPSFTVKMFSEAEIKYCEAKPEPEVHFAARFAAKEAVLKALGIGFSEGVGYRDVEVKLKTGGAPLATLHGKALELSNEAGVVDIPLSISHTNSEAVCVAIAITKTAIDAREKSKIAIDNITRQFKDLRGDLDAV